MKQKVILFGVDGLIPELIYKFAKEGHLPNMSKVLKEGAATELLPYINLWGDVNFTSLLSGQAPGTSWNRQGHPEVESKSLLRLMQTEGRKCALVHFPSTLPEEETKHFVFAPFGGKVQGNPIELISAGIFSTTPEKWSKQTQFDQHLGWPPQDTLAHHLKPDEHNKIKNVGDGFVMELLSNNGTALEVKISIRNEDSLQLTINQEVQLVLSRHQWSDWVTINIGAQRGTLRFKLLAFNSDKREIDILQSQVIAANTISINDEEIERKLLTDLGPFIQKWTVTCSPDEPYYETSYEEAEYQVEWLTKAALMLLKDCHYDVFATVFRLNDETHHTCIGEYDPISPFYSPERAHICKEVILKSYKILDKAIGKILDEKDDHTTLLIASDHGNYPNFYVCDIYRRLAECGLAVIDENGFPIFSQSKAYLKDSRGGLEVYVNLQGREEQGIVAPADYEQVQTDIFRALTTWYHDTPKGLMNVIGLTIKKQDASLLGYWGDRTGDVLFAYNRGFVWGTNAGGEAVAAVKHPSANHGPQIPTARSEHSSNYGIALFHGPTTMKGYVRECSRYGYYRMNDVGQTIARLIGLKENGDLDGRFMADCFKPL
ncbi:hypothetical protein GCM10011391_03000 [Pullulanibacillus camelliae]|uniref:Nucleotide pyrophosphatase n=1 Tax=Pullulanibacillus camelliae TaxID=1707096 RepID=A0A8J2VK76_9BACL|nr:alkaline phosphatase family protein [Pullulanibacillus camelliae]GGE27915.1 hypothetical protein GCM10011391_03000 [Pullulanibacillus camelliae]